MSNLAQKSKTDIAAAYNRAMSTLKNAKEQSRAITGRAVGSVLTSGAGWGVGALRSKFGEGDGKKLFIPGTQVEADLAAGVLIVAAGVVGLAGDRSEELCAVGNGVLAGHLAIAAVLG